jgi:Family of unknown function (DUF6263)
MRSHLCVWILGVALVLPGCSKASDKTGSSKKKVSALRSIPEKMTVKLLTAGSGPKQKLRYRFGAPQTHRVVVTIAMSVGVSTKERSVPVQKMPDMEMYLTLENRAVSPTGTLSYVFRLTRAGLTGEGGGAMKQRFSKALGPALAQLTGLTGGGEVTPRGVATHAKLKIPEGLGGSAHKAVQSLQEQLGQLSTPLPEVAVGVGAQWEVRKPLSRSTMRMAQLTKYTLVKLQGSKVTLDVRLEQFAPSQDLVSSKLLRGTKVTLHSLRSTGKGRFEIDLSSPVPGGSLSYESRLDQTISASDKSQRMQLDLKVSARFSPENSSTR